MLTGLADAHVKSGIVDGIRRQGMDVVTAQELGQSRAADEELLVTATRANRLMLTNDMDVLRLHAQWMQSGRHHSGIVYWAQNMGIGVAIRRTMQYVLSTTAQEAADRVHFL
jgi:hypothetical protein